MAQSEKKFKVAKEFYDRAKVVMEKLASKYGAPDELLDDYALLMLRLSTVELLLGNVMVAKEAVEKSIKYNPTAEVCIHSYRTVKLYLCGILY